MTVARQPPPTGKPCADREGPTRLTANERFRKNGLVTVSGFRPMYYEMFPPLIGLAFLVVLATAGGVLIQLRRDKRDGAAEQRTMPTHCHPHHQHRIPVR